MLDLKELVKINNDEQVITDSLVVAETFKKEHKNVLQAIKNLAAEKSAAKFFFVSSYENRGKEYTKYYMNRDGFCLLAMGFTGSDAIKWKIKYIEAFNKMEEELKKRKPAVPTTYRDAIAELLVQLDKNAELENKNQILIEENTELKEDNDHCRAIHNLKDEWGYSRIEICKNFLEDKIKHPTFTAMLIEDNILLDKDTINPLYIENGFMFKHLEKWSNNKGTSYVIKFTSNGKYSLEPYFISCVESGKAFDEVLNYDKKVTKIKKAINTKPSKNKRTIKEREEKLKAAKINLDNALDLYKTTIYNRQNILKDIIEDVTINNKVQ